MLIQYGLEDLKYIKKDKLARHSNSIVHLQSIKSNNSKDELQNSVCNAISKNEYGITSIMKNVYWLAKQNIAINSCTSLHALVVNQLELSANKIPIHYRSDTHAWQMIEVFSGELYKEMVADIQQSKYFSMSADESTDIAVHKNLLLYVRYLKGAVVKTKFLKLVEIPCATAEFIFTTIMNILKDSNLEAKNLIGWASDGAKVMLGIKNGVQARLRVISPCLTAIHDPGHRENLAVSEAYEDISYLSSVIDGTINNISSYFNRSSNRIAELQELQKHLEEPQLKQKKLYSIRWLARYEAMNSIRKCLHSLMTLFPENDKDPLALSIYQHLVSFKFLCIFHAINDIVNDLAILSKFLQRSDLHPYDIYPLIEKLISQINSNFASPDCNPLLGGPCIKNIYLKLSNKPILFNGCVIKYDSSEESIKKVIRDFSSKVTENLSNRYNDAAFYQRFKIFDPLAYPQNVKDLNDFGEEELASILEVYCDAQKGILQDWDMEMVNREFSLFKQFVIDNAKSLKFHELLKLILTQHYKPFPFMSELIKICSILPVGSVDCERGFSQQNLIKTRIRNRLKSDHLDDLMMIKMNGPEVSQFDFKSCLVKFIDKTKVRFSNQKD